LVIDTQRRVPTTLILRRIECGTFVSGAADFAFSSLKPPPAYRKPATMIRQILDLLEIASGVPIAAPETSNVDAAFARRAADLLPEGPAYVGFAPGAGGRHKCWPLERYIAVANAQAARGRVPVLVLGPDEADWHDGLREAVPRALFPLQDPRAGAEAKSPLLTIALAARLRAAVANDSGGGHLLAAGGVPLISLGGPSAFEKAAPQAKTLRKIVARDYGGTAMTFIPIDAVEAALEDLLAAAAQPSGAVADGGGEAPARADGG
jgi:ADP-heptose:LPS heptosyltransferase